LPSKDNLVKVDQANQVNPHDWFSGLHQMEEEDSVLDTIEGLIKIGLTESKVGKEPKPKRLSGRRRRQILKKAESTMMADITNVEPQCAVCQCRNGGEHCKRQCSQMFILEKTAVFPKRDINIHFQKTPLETEAIRESIGLLQCNKISSDYVVTAMVTGVNGLN
jgi:hypothetical protein